MQSYRVQLNTDVAWAETEIVAGTVDEAFAAAANLDSDTLVFAAFTDPRPVNEIMIEAPDGVEWLWQDEELLLRLAAEDLLIASKNLLTALKTRLLSEGCDPVTMTALRHLKTAIDMAEGRQA
jgi:hypothetical protein